MASVSQVAQVAFVHYFEVFRDQVINLSSKVSEEQFFAKPYAYGNTIGNLVLHLTGNLNYYIGSQIENNGYVRDREMEFAAVRDGSRTNVLNEFTKTISMVTQSLSSQKDADWIRVYQANGVDDVHDRFSIYLRCCVHFHHHIGQMIYLVKEWELKNS